MSSGTATRISSFVCNFAFATLSRPPTVIILHEARGGGRERERVHVCRRSIARERAPPIDLRAAYLLHYYRPRLILFRRKRPRIRSSRIAHDSSIVSIHSLFSFRIARGDEKCYGEKTTRVDRIYENSSKGTENYPDEQSDGVPRHDRIWIERNTWEIPCPPAAVQSPCRSTDLSTGATFLRLLRDLLCTINLTLA